MMIRTAPFLAILVACFFSRATFAIWMRSYSLEWWINISDTVAVVEVVSTKKAERGNEHWQSQQVRCVSKATLKGRCPDSVEFDQRYREQEQGTRTYDAVLRPKMKVLVLSVCPAGAGGNETVFWVNLTKPDAKFSAHAPYDNDCQWLQDGDSVLSLVKERIGREHPGSTKKRGVIVGFALYKEGLMYWDFVRTADPEYKAKLIEQLQDGNKESAIYNLVSYPGPDTRDLIRPFLKGPTISELQVYDGKDASGRARFKRVKIYRLRQAAYSALELLGESPEKPDGYYPDPFLWLFEVGFENRSHFPHGDWKRFDN